MEEYKMEITNEMYTKLFNAITDAQIRLQQARKCVVQAEVILSSAQQAAEEIFLKQD